MPEIIKKQSAFFFFLSSLKSHLSCIKQKAILNYLIYAEDKHLEKIIFMRKDNSTQHKIRNTKSRRHFCISSNGHCQRHYLELVILTDTSTDYLTKSQITDTTIYTTIHTLASCCQIALNWHYRLAALKSVFLKHLKRKSNILCVS